MPKLFEDSPEKRTKRRRFFTDSLNERTLPPGETKESFLKELESFDEKIADEKVSKKDKYA